MNSSSFSKFLVISLLLHILLLTVFLLTVKNRQKKPATPMMASLITPQELKKLAPPPVARPRPKIIRPRMIRPERKKSHSTRPMPLPRLTPRELRNMRLHGGLTEHVPKPVKRVFKKAQAPTAPKTGSLSARKGNGGKTPPAKISPPGRGPGNPQARSGNREKPGTRLVRPDLFDPGVIGKVAMNDSRVKEAQSNKKGVITFDTSNAKYIGYMRLLRIEIESIWKYPRRAAYSGEQGDLEIRFTINRQGLLTDVRVLRGSGFPLLDEAAVQALRDGRYWPLPDSWHKKKLTIDGHFVYSLHGAATQLW